MEINFKESELDAMLQGEHQKPYAEKEYLEEELVSDDSKAPAELVEEFNKAIRNLVLSNAGHRTETKTREPKKRGLGATRKASSKRKK